MLSEKIMNEVFTMVENTQNEQNEMTAPRIGDLPSQPARGGPRTRLESLAEKEYV